MDKPTQRGSELNV